MAKTENLNPCLKLDWQSKPLTNTWNGKYSKPEPLPYIGWKSKTLTKYGLQRHLTSIQNVSKFVHQAGIRSEESKIIRSKYKAPTEKIQGEIKSLTTDQ